MRASRLHRRLLGGGRKLTVESQIDGGLAVVVGPVTSRERLNGGTRHGLAAEHRKLLAELGVVDGGERLVTELERFLEPGNECVLAVARDNVGAIRKLRMRFESPANLAPVEGRKVLNKNTAVGVSDL